MKKVVTKQDVNRYCSKVNFPLPRISGKNKIAYIWYNISYTVQQNLIEMFYIMGYKIKYYK